MRTPFTILVAVVVIAASGCSDEPTGGDNPTVASYDGTCGYRISSLLVEGKTFSDVTFAMFNPTNGSVTFLDGARRIDLSYEGISYALDALVGKVELSFPASTGTHPWNGGMSKGKLTIGGELYKGLTGTTSITEVTGLEGVGLYAQARGEFNGVFEAPNGEKVAVKGRFTGCR